MHRTVALALALLAPSPALALSCAFGPTNAVPADRAMDVPVNVIPRVWVVHGGGEDSFDWSLVDEDGQAVDVSLDRHVQGNTTVVAVQPDADLAPETTYTLEVSMNAQPMQSWTFSTGSARDETAPATPTLERLRREKDRTEWGRTDHVRVEVEAAEEPVIYELTITETGADGLVGTVLNPGSGEDDVDTVWAGEGLCGSDVLLDGPVDVSVRAIDLAGNVSEASPSGAATGGCNSAAAPGGLAGLVLLPIFSRIRRRS